jgi:hypothetical protein
VTGEDVIVPLINNGVDSDHCFFSDISHQIPLDETDYLHRKVIYNSSFFDRFDKQ